MVIAPAFDHRDPGTDEQLWDSAWGRSARLARLDAVGSVLILAAHPDDETLGAGGLMNLAARRGLRVTVVVASLGERSHPNSPTHSPEVLRGLRRAEVRAAVGEVAAGAAVEILDLPDGALAQHIPELTQAVGHRLAGPDMLVLSPWVGDGHPDHSAVAVAAAAAAGRVGAPVWQFPIWAWHWSTPGDGSLPELLLLNLDAQARKSKARALQHHISQVRPLSDQVGDEPVLHDKFLAHFRRSYEAFVVSAPARTDRDQGTRPGQLSSARSAPASTRDSLPPAFFDDFYSGGADPWGFQTRWYEERKRAITLAALPRPRFRAAFEPGCSIGVLTEQLANRCDALLATDLSPVPLRTARQRLAGQPHVRIEQRQIPAEWPAGSFDLIVLSEIGYYCGADDLRSLAVRGAGSLTDDGVLIACHWRHPVAEYPQSGDEVHRVLGRHSGLCRLAGYSDADFLLDVFVPEPARSVAQLDGLVE